MAGRLASWLGGARAQLTTAGVEAAALEARVLAGHVLGMAAADVPLYPDRRLRRGERERMDALLRRRAAREPLQYVIGRAEFWTLTLEVTPEVLIPRPETEHLVEAALAHLRPADGRRAATGPGGPLLAADLGTGSGAVALALLAELPSLVAYGTDISAGALVVARRNAERLGVAARFVARRGDWCQPLLESGLEGRLDAVLANPPYVTPDESGALAPEVRAHEPGCALFTEDDALAAYRAIIGPAARLLRPGGLLACEVAPHRVDQVRALFAGGVGWGRPGVRLDYAGRARVLCATAATTRATPGARSP